MKMKTKSFLYDVIIIDFLFGIQHSSENFDDPIGFLQR